VYMLAANDCRNSGYTGNWHFCNSVSLSPGNSDGKHLGATLGTGLTTGLGWEQSKMGP